MKRATVSHRSARRSVFAALLALVVLALPAAASAYNLMTVPQFGCNAVAWPANLLPVPWYLNQNGYSGLPQATVVSAIGSGFDTWGAPCCSSFSGTYRGITADETSTSKNVMMFWENGWPSTLGDVNSTIGVAVPRMNNYCQIVEGDISFNATAITFIDGAPSAGQQKTADLTSIAVHETGHLLGLDHVSDPNATMKPVYSNGIDERSLSQDDIDGACFLYPVPASAGCSGTDGGGTVDAGSDVGVVEEEKSNCAIGTLRGAPEATRWWALGPLLALLALRRRRAS